MKKILTAIVLFVFVALPMSVMAMTTITDNDLSTVTGQAGVSIAADITMNVSFGTVAWGDSDGIGTPGTAAGWVGLRNGKIENLRIHMRSDLGMLDTSKVADYQSRFSSYSLSTEDAEVLSALLTNQFLTIDVYTDTTASTIFESGTGVATSGSGYKTYVRIGVPTFEIDMAKFTAEVGLWNDGPNPWETWAAPKFDTFQKMGNIYVANMVVLLGKDNYIDISANDTASGILIGVGNTTTPKTGTGSDGSGATHNMVDKAYFEAMAWGDDDGLHGQSSTAGGGYVGLTAVDIEAIKVTAKININVCTPTGFDISNLLTALRAAETHGDIALDIDSLNAFVASQRLNLAQGNKTAAGIAIKDSLAYLFHLGGIIGTTSVDIGLDNVYVNIGSMVANAALSADTSTMNLNSAIGNQNLLGQIYMKDLTIAIPAYGTTMTAYKDLDGHSWNTAPSSWVSISAH